MCSVYQCVLLLKARFQIISPQLSNRDFSVYRNTLKNVNNYFFVKRAYGHGSQLVIPNPFPFSLNPQP